MVVERVDFAHVGLIAEEEGVEFLWSARLRWTGGRWRWAWGWGARLLDRRGRAEELFLQVDKAGAVLKGHLTTGTKGKLVRMLAVEDEPQGFCERRLS